MTRLMILLAAIGGGLVGTSGAGTRQPIDPARAQRPAVVVEATCASPTSDLEAAARRAAALPGADVLLACGPADAQAVVLRAVASGHDLVLGRGPDVRAAMALAQADHPEVAFAPLGR